jgi:ABC-type transport system involved in multi-copper enzyme maturation permease subunit
MKTSKRSSPMVKIAKYTLFDEVRQRSFVVMFALCVVLVFLARGCYQGNYVVNGQALDPGTVAGTVSKAIFHIIAIVTMLIAALVSMRVFRRDRDEGTQSCILSKPITRRHYVLGKILGLWLLSAVFMFVLHAMVFLIASITMRAVMPGYLVASILCCLDLLFVVVAVLLLSLLMPEIVALLCVMGIAVVGLVIDGIHAVGSSQVFQAVTAATDGRARADLSSEKILYYLWPKLSGMQHFASSFINGEGSPGFSAIYPLVNIALYCLLVGALLLWRFGKEEIV